MLRIHIPTKGRPNKQPTAEALRAAGIPFTLVCTLSDPAIQEYIDNYGPRNVMVVDVINLMHKRQLIFDSPRQPGGKIIMMDDDLTFYARRKDGGFEKATPKQLVSMIEFMSSCLDRFAHVGLVDKFMSQNQPRGMKYRGRYNQVLAYNTKLIRKRWTKSFGIGLHHDMPKFRSRLNQEHDMHLQLLRLGLMPAILCEYSKNAAYYSKGGLTGFRTPKLERAVFNELVKNWPDYVRLRKTRHAIGGVAATFNWRRAMQEGLRRWEDHV
jgi:hypothetical protein